MKNFSLIGRGIDVKKALEQISSNNFLWNQNTIRKDMPGSGHGAVDDIWIRFNQIIKGREYEAFNDLECIYYPAHSILTVVANLVTNLFMEVGANKIGRVFVSKIAPGNGIKAHRDEGRNPEFYTRFHICLQSSNGCTFRCGDETVEMVAGECWKVDNRVEHEVFNGGDVDRIHLICDMRTDI